jgi:hypothetical protein
VALLKWISKYQHVFMQFVNFGLQDKAFGKNNAKAGTGLSWSAAIYIWLSGQ